MVGLLVNAGMYDKALTICQLFGMKLTSVFDSLALRYVYSCVSILVQYSAMKLSNIYVVQIIKLLKKHYFIILFTCKLAHIKEVQILFRSGLLSCVNKLKRFLTGSG